MPGSISKRTLLVVSDTAMMVEGDRVLAFEPVLRELRAIEDLFDEIIWLGATTLKKKPSLVVVNEGRIRTVLLPCISHEGWKNIFYVLWAYPVMLYHILKYRKQATHVHSRGPAHPAFIAIILSLLDGKRIYAHKYAGEWTENNIPLTYRLQRAILRRIVKPNVKITISGRNTTNHSNVFDLHNPCVYEHELKDMNAVGLAKDFSGRLEMVFVGNMMPSKGIMQLLQALSAGQLSNRYAQLHIVGSGVLLAEVKKAAAGIKNIALNITGNISRNELNMIYARAHILILPSSSESFPKVIAEAAAYGCIPVVTALSAITKQIQHGVNGFLLQGNQPANILTVLNEVAGNDSLKQVSLDAVEMSGLYTYERFRESMKQVYGIHGTTGA